MSDEGKTSESTYAVIVDPMGWETSLGPRLLKVYAKLAELADCPPLTPRDELGTRLERGPSTIARGVPHAVAARLVDLLAELSVRAKIARLASATPDLPDNPSPADRPGEAAPKAPVVGWKDLVFRPTDAPPLPRSALPQPESPSPEPAPGPRSTPPRLGPLSPAPVRQEAMATSIPRGILGAARPDFPDHEVLPGRMLPPATVLPSPRLTGFLGALAPGAGQLYLRQDDEFRSSALTGLLVLPWIRSAVSAQRRAKRIRLGLAVPRGRLALETTLAYILVFWISLALLAIGCVALYRHLTRPTMAPFEDVAAAELLDRAEAAVTASADTDGPTPSSDGSSSLGIVNEIDERMDQAHARRFLLMARAACDAEDYAMCSVLATEARRLDPALPEAIRLFHRASLALELGQGDQATTTDNEEARP